ncbi:protein phosphatase 2C domain-containing protein [Allobaculum sp. Allo2]|uniref:protein phosphatase 2C domain-containing protein n=1 Tax=Allobaculum sp. Allo2 TaxID=2853432 RepID=UPI001F6160DF|nr:protein phosphatase 2C domain-containing protein [Allobaculum sp. Allo2]UNT93092.1 protein phosphatase 2C domain-containing protein [Allobaculum sp. Allo2]
MECPATGSRKTGCSVEDYSCIYAALRYDRDTDRLFYLSLGDAMILAMGEETDRGLLVMPASKQNGTPASTTVHGERLLQIGHVCGKPYTSILLCSDGAWSLLYDRNRMKTEARKLIESENFEGITGYLKKETVWTTVPFSAPARKLDKGIEHTTGTTARRFVSI